MAEPFDPSKLYVATRLIKDEDDAGVIIDEHSKEWKSGELEINLFDKTSRTIATHREKVTRNKYNLLREDLDGLNTQEIIERFFKDVDLTEASQTPLQVEAARSARETAEREEERKNTEKEEEARSLISAPVTEREDEGFEGTPVADNPSDFHNVRPVGDPDETPSNPEQKIDAAQAAKIVAEGKEVVNPEQSAPNVPEDEFKTKGGNDVKTSVTNDVERNVLPVGAEAKTLKEVAQADTTAKNGEVVETKRPVPATDGDVSGVPKAGKTVDTTAKTETTKK